MLLERWICRYNNAMNHRYPCRQKGCLSKLRNGRCGLDMARLECDEHDHFTGKCLDFKPTGGVNQSTPAVTRRDRLLTNSVYFNAVPAGLVELCAGYIPVVTYCAWGYSTRLVLYV